MSKLQTLKTLVNERLAAAAEDVFLLFERTIVEYEEELCRCKEENQKKQQLLDKVLFPTIRLVRGNFHVPSTSSPGPGPNQEISETSRIKDESEEVRVKQEEEQPTVCVPESSTENSSLLQPNQKKQGEDSEAERRTEHSSDSEHDRENPKQSAAETSVQKGDVSAAHGAKEKKHQCLLCQRSFKKKQGLKRHNRVHSGDKALNVQQRAHTKGKRYTCTVCNKHFDHNQTLKYHTKTHTEERPIHCSVCGKGFIKKMSRDIHMRTHTGERPYKCSVCGKGFIQKSDLNLHMRTHTGEKPHSCNICGKKFTLKGNLDKHRRTHTKEKLLKSDKAFIRRKNKTKKNP